MNIDPDITHKLLAGGSGSALAAWIARATGFNLFMMFAGGIAAAYFLCDTVAGFFGIATPKGIGAVGFIIGFVGIVLLRKGFEAIEKVEWYIHLNSLVARWIGKKTGTEKES